MSVWFNPPRSSTGGFGTSTTPIHPPTPIHRLTVREKLELSPWAKWSLYGYFPWKMCLHVTLVVLITLQATLVNMHYAAYSRAVGRSFINLFFPPTHASPDVGDFTYHIFDVRDTISDAHRLLETYFRLPELSVDAVNVATPNPSSSSSSSTPQPQQEPQEQKHDAPIRLPQITLTYHNPTKLPDVFFLPNASAAWPFQVNGPVQQWLKGANGGLPEMRSFLDDLKKIDFDFRVRSKGWGGGVDRNREVCVMWSLGFVYDLSVGGQFSVGMDYRPEARCSPLGVGDRYVILCLLIGMVSAVYQLLLFRSAWERFKILRYLKKRTETPCHSQHGREGEGGRERGREEEDRPRHPSAFSSPVRSSGGSGREEGEGEEEEGKGVEGERLPLLASGATAARRSSAAAGGEGGGGGGGGGEGGGYQSMAPSHRPHLSTSSSSSTSSSPSSSRIILLHPPPRPTSPLPPTLPPLLITTTTTSKGYDALTWLDKLELFGLWPAVALLGNVCALTYTLQSLSSHTHVDIFANPSLRLLLGLACLMLWLALIQYLEFESRYYVMILTLKRAVPRIGQFLLGIAPMFLGYALLGMILFGDQNPLFGSLLRTVGTLFCVVNGDSIKVVLDSLGGTGVGVIYVVVYMTLFTYVVLMTCIAIVEEAFFSSAEYAHSLWVGEEEGGKEGGKVQMQIFSPYENGAGQEQQRQQEGGSYSSYHSGPPPSQHLHEQQQQQQQQQHEGGEHDYIPVLSMAGVSYTSLSTSSAISASSSSSSSRPPSPPHYPTPSSSTTSSSFLPNPPGLRSRQNSTGSANGAFEPVLSSSSPLPPSIPLPPPPSSYLPSRLTTPAPSPLNTGSSTHATPRSSSSSPALLPSLPPPPPPPPGQGMKRTPSGSRVMSAKLRQLIHEADAAIALDKGGGGEGGREGGYGFQPVMLGEVGRSQSASASSSTTSFSASGGGAGRGGGGGGGGGGWDRRRKEEEDSAQSQQQQQQVNISEALNELQALLLRQVARGGGVGGGGGEGRHVQTGGEGEDASAAIRQAIENTKHKLLVSASGGGGGGPRRDSREGGREGGRRPSSSAGILPTQREGEEEDGVGSIGSSSGSGGGGEEKEEERKKGRRNV